MALSVGNHGSGQLPELQPIFPFACLLSRRFAVGGLAAKRPANSGAGRDLRRNGWGEGMRNVRREWGSLLAIVGLPGRTGWFSWSAFAKRGLSEDGRDVYTMAQLINLNRWRYRLAAHEEGHFEVSQSGGIGRRAGFKIQCPLRACRFESDLWYSFADRDLRRIVASPFFYSSQGAAPLLSGGPSSSSSGGVWPRGGGRENQEP